MCVFGENVCMCGLPKSLRSSNTYQKFGHSLRPHIHIWATHQPDPHPLDPPTHLTTHPNDPCTHLGHKCIHFGHTLTIHTHISTTHICTTQPLEPHPLNHQHIQTLLWHLFESPTRGPQGIHAGNNSAANVLLSAHW